MRIVPNLRLLLQIGNVKLLEGKQIVLIPTPSPDPNDPLNLPTWRKWAILVLVSACGCTAVVLASGFGPIFSMVVASYPGQTEKANDLITYPTLFMRIGNLIAMPLAMTIGRRPVFFFLQCLNSHIGGRNVMSLAAGQSEALAPMIVLEIFFLHERGTKLGWFIFIECTGTGVIFIVSIYMTAAWGWRWWYAFFSITNGAILLLSFIFISETLYDRPEDATTGEVELNLDQKGDMEKGGEIHQIFRVTTSQGVVLEREKFGPRTWRKDLELVSVKPKWSNIVETYKHIAQAFYVPSMLWLLLLNGAFLGLYVLEVATFSDVLMSPPYLLSFTDLGYVQAGQIIDCLIFLPLLGMWSISAPNVAYNASYFAFLEANVVSITYAVESFPLQAGSLLVVLCAGRGFISFGLSYATLTSIKSIRYDGATIAEAAVAGALAIMAVPLFFFGPKIRSFGQRAFDMGPHKETDEFRWRSGFQSNPEPE
ncbi:hypothetical protein M433DRAFT_147447 [Acidomyces richmondensis BFW]|nr:hypothetical protein M433DRAFT_147447 [Acidomyces richmondensis BFW]